MIYENKDIEYIIITIQDLLFDISITKADLERKDLWGGRYDNLKQMANDLEQALNLINKYI